MAKLIDLDALEIEFFKKYHDFNDCFILFHNKHKKQLIEFFSDLDLLKNMSYTFKENFSLLQKKYIITIDALGEINSNILNLETMLVKINTSKSIDDFIKWFDLYHEVTIYIIKTGMKNQMFQNENTHVIKESEKELMIRKINSLL